MNKSREQLVNDLGLPRDGCEPLVETLVAVREALVVEAEEMQERGV